MTAEHPAPDARRDLEQRLRDAADSGEYNTEELLREAAEALAAAQQALAEREAMIEAIRVMHVPGYIGTGEIDSDTLADDLTAIVARTAEVRRILTASPSTALREHDARVLEEAADAFATAMIGKSTAGWLRARAAAIRAGEATS